MSRYICIDTLLHIFPCIVLLVFTTVSWTRLEGGIQFFSKRLFIMEYRSCQTYRQSFLVLMLAIPHQGCTLSSIAGVRFSLLLRICFCFTTMASYREINILAHYIKNLKLNSTFLLLSPSKIFLKGLVPPILLWVNTLLCQILVGGWINRVARSHHI